MAKLLQAIREKDLAQTRSLLCGEGVNAAYEYYQDGTWGAHERTSPIHQALFNLTNERYEVVKEKGKEAAAQHHFQWRDIVLELMRKGANVNAKHESYDWRGCGSSKTGFEIILSVVTDTGDAEMLALALQRGGDPNTRSEYNTHSMRTDGRTVSFPIHTAAAQLSYTVLKTLLDAKANVNALYVATYHNERGYNSDTAETALHMAIAAGRNKEEKQRDRVKVLHLLLEAGADVNAERRELVQEEVDVESPTDDPREAGFIPSVRCVRRRETPLVMALRLGLADEARLLVAYGADTTASLHYGKDAPRSVWDLAAAGDDELKAAVRCRWEPRYHHLYPAAVRRSIFAAMCVAKLQAWPLPVELLNQVFQWVAVQVQVHSS